MNGKILTLARFLIFVVLVIIPTGYTSFLFMGPNQPFLSGFVLGTLIAMPYAGLYAMINVVFPSLKKYTYF